MSQDNSTSRAKSTDRARREENMKREMKAGAPGSETAAEFVLRYTEAHIRKLVDMIMFFKTWYRFIRRCEKT
jgi:hypothetical protein